MLNKAALAKAMHVFNRARTSAHGAVEAAIAEYKIAEVDDLLAAHSCDHLQIAIADTDKGPNTALVIIGFKNLAEVECFVSSRLYAQGK